MEFDKSQVGQKNHHPLRKRITSTVASLCGILIAALTLNTVVLLLAVSAMQPADTTSSISINANDTSETVFRTYAFMFNDTLFYINATVDRRVYIGARDVRVYPSYSSIIHDPAQDAMYESILRQTRSIQEREGWDEFTYFLFLCRFVQSIPYERYTSYPRYPVEVIVDRGGDCDDKSLLLVGLLEREGYNVSLLYYEDIAHMKVGLGDIPIETTTPTEFGYIPQNLSEPTIIYRTDTHV